MSYPGYVQQGSIRVVIRGDTSITNSIASGGAGGTSPLSHGYTASGATAPLSLFSEVTTHFSMDVAPARPTFDVVRDAAAIWRVSLAQTVNSNGKILLGLFKDNGSGAISATQLTSGTPLSLQGVHDGDNVWLKKL